MVFLHSNMTDHHYDSDNGSASDIDHVCNSVDDNYSGADVHASDNDD